MYALKHWDRERGHVPAASKHPLGDLYIAWQPEAIYLAAVVMDIVEPDYYRTSDLPKADRAEWTIRINNGPAVSALLGGGLKPVLGSPELRLASLSGVYHDVRSVTVVELPAKRCGRDRFQTGDRISLDSEYTTHGRAYRMKWKSTLTLVD
jgi:hypothetical protein